MYEACTLQDVERALQYLSPDCPRDEWVRIGMALKNEFPDAFDVFDTWSQGGGSYKPRDCLAAWKSFKAGGGIGIGTLFAAAVERGFEFERRELTAEEKARFAQERKVRQQRREALEQQEQAEARLWHAAVAEASQKIWASLAEIGESKYLGAKRVGAYGVRFVRHSMVVRFVADPIGVELITGRDPIKQFFSNRHEDESFLFLQRGALVVPLYDEHMGIANLQVIFATGKKRFLKHGRKSGCYHVIGKIDDADLIAFAEGYATAATVHEVTRWPVVVTFDCGNIMPVVGFWRERLPDTEFLIAADNDYDTDGNPGVTKAREAACRFNAALAVPPQEVA